MPGVSDVYSLLAGVLIGLSLAVPPGPVNAIIAAESVRKSCIDGIKVGLGAMTADATFLAITLIGVAVLLTGETIKIVVSLAGGLLLAYMAIKILKGYKRPIKENGKEEIRNHYVTGVIVGITNPASILWWATAGAALIANFNAPGIAGFFIGIFIWVASFAITLDYAQKKVEWLYPAIMLISGAVLLFFSIVLGYNAIMMAL
jgi:threonine/homoserine/homoserine lactone efflux protein